MIEQQTFNRRFTELCEQINNHSHREELLQIMAEQVADDTEMYHF